MGSRWKLHLRPKHLASIESDDALHPLPPGKSAVDVLTDFIKYLFRCAKTYIEEHHLAFTWSTIEHSVEYIFTHPNGWEGVQQQQYRRAIASAGLIPSTPEGQSRVHMLTEGEASLHFCVSNLLNGETTIQAAPQGVVIIDAGGGTIDLSMFSMTSAPISGAEIAPAECKQLSPTAEFLLTFLYPSLGRLQGSVFVTRRARALLQRWWLVPSIDLLVTNLKTLKTGKLEGWEHSSVDEIAEFTREFDQTTKLIIKNDQEPAYIRVGGRRTSSPKYNISFGKLKLTG